MLLLPLALLGCGGGRGGDTAQAPATSLVVERDGVRVTLTCDPPGGDHPSPEAACAVVDALVPLADDAVCAQVFGGPETATVRGTVRGRPVDLALSRTDACRTAQWDRLAPLLDLGP